jgi:transposase
MLKNKRYEVNKANIQDASWDKLIFKCSYKAVSADKNLIDRVSRYSTMTHTQCGSLNDKLLLSNRTFKCKFNLL